MEKAASRSITVVLLVVIAALIVRQCSDRGDDTAKSSEKEAGFRSLGSSSSRVRNSRSRLTRSDRKEVNGDHLDFEIIDVDGDESVLFTIQGLEEYDGIQVHLHAVREVDDDGVEQIRLAPKLFDTSEASPGALGLEELPPEDQHRRFEKEIDRQFFFRKLAQTKGVDIMTSPSQSLPEGASVEIVCCPGLKQLLMIEAKAQRGRDGRLRVKFGDPYLRAREDGEELLRAISPVPVKVRQR